MEVRAPVNGPGGLPDTGDDPLRGGTAMGPPLALSAREKQGAGRRTDRRCGKEVLHGGLGAEG